MLSWTMVMLVSAMGAVWTAASASAHATLIASTPTDGGQLDESPTVLSFELNEPVSLVEGSAQLIDADGTRYPLASQRLEAGRQRIVVELAEPVPDGAYLATARVVSADTHVVSLSSRFTVGAGAAQGQWELGGQTVVGRSIVLPVKIVVYLGTVLSAGLLLAARWGWPDVIGSRRFRAVYRAGSALLAVGLLGRLLVLVVEQAGGWSEASLSAVTAIAGTPFGLALTAAVGLSLGALLFPPASTRATMLLGFLQAAAAITAVTLGGHGGSTEFWPLPFLVTFVHVYAVAVWLGGVSVLAFVTPGLPDVQRWHRVAVGHVVLVVAAGVALALFQVRPLAAVVTTSYGVTLAAKVLAVSATIAAGYAVYRNSRAVVQGRRRTLAVEATLAVAVIAVTSSLSSLTPAKDSYTTDVATTVDFGGRDVLDVHIDTVRRGTQVVTVSYPAAQTGSAPIELGLELSSAQANVARLPVEVSQVRSDSGGVEWRSDGLIVPSAGRWKVTMRFDDGTGPKLASFFYTVL